MGFATFEDGRIYCYRHDLMGKRGQPSVSFFYFQVGYKSGSRKIFEPQLKWFETQMQADMDKGWRSPILVFVHIPLVEYETLASKGKAAGGFQYEKVHFDSDTGDSFRLSLPVSASKAYSVATTTSTATSASGKELDYTTGALADGAVTASGTAAVDSSWLIHLRVDSAIAKF